MLTHLHFKTIDSTQSYIYKELHKKDYSYLAITAENQSQGYGQIKRFWESKKGGIYLSLASLLINKKEKENLSLIIAEYIARYLNQKFKIKTTIKFPNDIYLDKKKLAGLLSEIKKIRDNWYLIIGIGLNLNQQDFSEDLRNKAISLYQNQNKTFNINKIQKELIFELKNFCENKL